MTVPRTDAIAEYSRHRDWGWSRHLALLFAIFIACGIISVLRGQNNWWDVANYHIYNPWAWLTGRWSKDVFVAGIQGYFYPLADIPYYEVSMRLLAGYPRAVAVLAAIPYTLFAYFALLISNLVFERAPHLSRAERNLQVVAVWILSVTGISAWSQFASATNDVTIAVLVLAATYLLLRCIGPGRGAPTAASVAWIGVLLGVATGLKLTAGLYVAGMGITILIVSGSPTRAVRQGLIYGACAICAFGIVYGPWAYHLVGATGDPFFPLFNNVFHSGFAAAVPGRDPISMPANIWEWLFYPAFWLNPHRPTVYNIHPFRDARFFTFYFAAIVYFIVTAVLFVRKRALAGRKVLWAGVVLMAISYGVWLVIFSKIRYAVAMECLVSILGVALIYYGVSYIAGRRYRSVGTVALLIAVIVIMATTVYPYSPRIPFGRKVFSAHVPALPRRSLIVFANQPMGILAPLMAEHDHGLTFIGIPNCFVRGQYCHDQFLDYGLGKQITQRLSAHHGPVYVAYYMNKADKLGQLREFGVRFDKSRCVPMSTNLTPRINVCAASVTWLGPPQHRRSTSAELAPAPIARMPVLRNYPSASQEKKLKLAYPIFLRYSADSVRLTPFFPGTSRWPLSVRLAPSGNGYRLKLQGHGCKFGVAYDLKLLRGKTLASGVYTGTAGVRLPGWSARKGKALLTLRMVHDAKNNYSCTLVLSKR